MDKNFSKEMKIKLENEREEIRKRLGYLGKESNKVSDDFQSDFPDYGDKEEDNATEVAQYQDNIALESSLEGRIQEIDEALEQIEKGRYGICSICQKEIARERLQINPAAKVCVNCK